MANEEKCKFISNFNSQKKCFIGSHFILSPTIVLIINRRIQNITSNILKRLIPVNKPSVPPEFKESLRSGVEKLIL